MKKLGLIGYPLGHSFSQPYFTKKFEKAGLTNLYAYENFPLKDIKDLPDLLKSTPDLVGLNVTIPYKKAVLPYLNILDADAAKIGAVNVIKVEKTGTLKGYNTDFSGFGKTLKKFLATHGGMARQALVLGTGGAAKAIIFALEKEKIPYQSVSRSSGKNQLIYEDLTPSLMADIDLIINTTPLGMHPNIASCPNIPYHCLTKNHRLYDIVYNPSVSAFLKRGSSQGAATINGLPMLYAQAEDAWNIWIK